MAQDVFTTMNIVHITGFSERQLDYWARQGIVVPSVQQSHGPGSRRLYAIEDLVQLNFIRQLKRHGWSTQKIREAIVRLREVMSDPNPLKSAMLFDGKGTMLALCKTIEGERILLDALSTGGQLVMGIVLEMLIEETLRAVTYSDEEYQLNRFTG
jgi:DNA-binding transcriptional MerR regulator